MSTVSIDQITKIYLDGVSSIVEITNRFDEADWDKQCCGEWSTADTARHLLSVTDWYNSWLDRAIDGDSSIPFTESAFDAQGKAGIQIYSTISGQESVEKFAMKAKQYLDRASLELERPFGFPLGTVTVGQHLGIAATEWHLHAWDLSTVSGELHKLRDAEDLMIAAADGISHTKNHIQGTIIRKMAPLVAKKNPWGRLISESGRKL